jgi:3D (Asp-Asp-Asp) domain-containing protein
MYVETTAYVVNPNERGKCATYTNRTASGAKARVGIVAVDPRTFPFGTRFRIKGYGYGLAGDTGGAILNKHLDLAMNSCKAAYAWGRRHSWVSYEEPKK